MSNWIFRNQLSLNVSKSAYIVFSIYNDKLPDINLHVTINKIDLKRVENAKYLDIIIDQKIRWDVHINSTVNKTRYLMYIFSRLKRLISYDSLIILYYELFRSVVDYGFIARKSAYNSISVPCRDGQKNI